MDADDWNPSRCPKPVFLFGSTLVSLRVPDSGAIRSMTLWFSRRRAKQLEILVPDTQLTVIGRITEIGQFGVTMSRCRLEKVGE
jgi:hypothetical protein